MKINYALTSRVLIALLFVVAGLQKLGIDVFTPSTIIVSLSKMGDAFNGTAGFISTLNVPMAGLVTAIVIFVEIVVAAAFAYGYRVCATGCTLIAFTLLATVLVHRDFSVGVNMVMALKNLAIVGGILATIQLCECGICPMSKGSKK